MMNGVGDISLELLTNMSSDIMAAHTPAHAESKDLWWERLATVQREGRITRMWLVPGHQPGLYPIKAMEVMGEEN